MEHIYLDHAATTPVIREVIDAVADCLEKDYGNPSSLHRLGIQAEKRIKEAKLQISQTLRSNPDEIVFTSGGTEANNLAIFGTTKDKHRLGKHCITTAIEHPSVLHAFELLEKQGFEVTYLPVDQNGVISLEALSSALRPDTILVSIMHVNNEIGSVQPIDKAGPIIRKNSPRAVFHVDAIQSFGKLQLDPKAWDIDLLTISGHKIHAPKGIGALHIKKGVRLQPVLIGGGQQGGLRSGTENITGIVGMGEGAKWIRERFLQDSQRLFDLKKLLITGIKSELSDVHINGNELNGAPHILNISFPGLKGEVLLHTLESEGVYVSTGSACSSRDRRISHVLKAIGLEDKAADGSIRISISYLTTEEEIKAFIPILVRSVKNVEKYIRR